MISQPINIEIAGGKYEIGFETRLILSVLTTCMVPPTSIGEELLSENTQIVQGAFDRLALVLTGRPAPRPKGTLSDVRTPTLMDQEPETLRRVAGQVEDLLSEIRIDINSIEPFPCEGETFEELQRIVGDDILPLDKGGTTRLHYLGGHREGEQRILACVGNSPRAQALASTIAIGMHLLPAWIRTLRETADAREAAIESRERVGLRNEAGRQGAILRWGSERRTQPEGATHE